MKYLLLLGFFVPFNVKWIEFKNHDRNSIGSPGSSKNEKENQKVELFKHVLFNAILYKHSLGCKSWILIFINQKVIEAIIESSLTSNKKC